MQITKTKIDLEGTLYLFNLFILIITGLYNLDNFIGCWGTSLYKVWVCDQSITYWIAHISFVIWLIWTIWIIIYLICFKWVIPEEIPFEQTKCPVCKQEMEHFKDENVEQLYCEKCGIWYNI